MRLDFNILWVEDQPALVDGTKKTLQRVMADEGFDLNVVFDNTLYGITRRLSDEIFRDEIDLILVDWDLGGNLKGQTVITAIREDVPYRDIVFYSAKFDVGELRKASFEAQNDGVFFATRNELVEDVKQLFHGSIKKVLDLDHIRGIVMGATSDVDQTARECLLLAYELLDDNGKQGVVDEMVDLLGEKGPNLTQRVEKLTAKPNVRKIVAEHYTFTANDGLRILTRLLDLPQFAGLEGHKAHVKTYIAKVVPQRNILGHKVLTPEGRPAGIAGDEEGKVISIDDMRELRRLLLELRGEFKGLAGALRDPRA